MGVFPCISLIALCCIIIWRASGGFEVASGFLGRKLNDGVRGATINAIGSSMPELFTTLFFFFYYVHFENNIETANDGFAGGIGTTAGSAIFNSMIIPAVVIIAVIGFGLAQKVEVSKKVILRDGLALILAEICLILLISGATLNWWHGIILMAFYGLYIYFMLRNMSADQQGLLNEYIFCHESYGKTRLENILRMDLVPVFIAYKINNKNAFLLLFFSMLAIGFACFFLVYACEQIANQTGVEPYFVAVILASAATSIPDTIISYRDAINGEYDDAVANALGSNIFDICFALGFPLFIFTIIYGPVEMSQSTIENVTELRTLLLLLTISAFLVYYIGRGMGKFKAIVLLLIYVLFSIYVYAKATDAEWTTQVGAFLRSILN